jgi:5-methylcytosine-specific restriction endonuclease McrA
VRPGRCEEHEREANRRRAARNREAGRSTYRWKQLRAEAFALAGGVCMDCGARGVRLSAHLHPALRGDHFNATLADVRVLCLRCHGARDGGRASR